MLKAVVTLGAAIGVTALVVGELSKPKQLHTPQEDQIPTNDNVRDVKAIVFKANWCGACKRFAPDVEKYKVEIPRLSRGSKRMSIDVVEVDQQRDLANQYKIQSLPTVVYLVNGREVKRQLGAHDIIGEMAPL